MPEYVLILIRSLLSFIVLLALTRIMGKKQLSQLTFFDYVVGITIGSIASTMSVDQNVKISNGLISLIIWGAFPLILAYFGMKSRKFQEITDGRPAIVIKDGEVLGDIMKKNQLTIDELMMQLREKDIFKLDDVQTAVFETNGGLSVLKKSDLEPLTARDLGLKKTKEKAPSLLIADGEILKKNLSKLGLTDNWLIDEIKKQGAASEQDVFIAQVDSQNNLFVDLYSEQ